MNQQQQVLLPAPNLWKKVKSKRSKSLPSLPKECIDDGDQNGSNTGEEIDPINDLYRRVNYGDKLAQSVQIMVDFTNQFIAQVNETQLIQSVGSIGANLRQCREHIAAIESELKDASPANTLLGKEDLRTRKSISEMADALRKSLTLIDQNQKRLTNICKKVGVSLTKHQKTLRTHVDSAKDTLAGLNDVLMSMTMQTIHYCSGEDRKADVCKDIAMNRLPLTVVSWTPTSKAQFTGFDPNIGLHHEENDIIQPPLPPPSNNNNTSNSSRTNIKDNDDDEEEEEEESFLNPFGQNSLEYSSEADISGGDDD